MAMNLFDLFAKISLDSSDYDKTIRNAASKAESAKSSIDGLNKPIDKVEGAFKRAKKATDEGATAMQKSRSIMAGLQNDYDKAEKKVADLTDTYKKSVKETGETSDESIRLAKSLLEAEKEADKAAKAVDDYSDSLRNNGKTAEDAEKKHNKFLSALGKGAKTAAKIGGAALAAAAGATIGFGASAVKAGMEFDVSMAQVAATMGKTVDEIQDLRDYALEMGAKTAFSATQAADALNYMALAGYDAETSMKMLPNVLNLAAAGAMDLAQASDMITDTQSALGLSLEETSELVDKMAKASSKSNTSVSQLGEAMLTIGATAKTLSGGTTELSTALGILADNGTRGAEGGTRLRNIILSLSAPTDTAAKTLDRLGVSAYDATTGSLRPLQDILGDLNDSMEAMSDQEKTDIINTIFNKTDLGDVNALLATSAARWDELGAAIEDSSGAAEKMANTQLDNLAGDVTLFKSALEGAQIAISDKLTPTLREFVQLGTSGLSSITDAFKEGGLEGAFGALGSFLSDAIANITSLAPTIIKAAVSLITALINGIRENAPLLIDAAFEIIDVLVGSLSDPEGLLSLVDAATQIITKLVEGLAEALPTLLPAVVEIIMTIVEKLTEPDMLDSLIEAAIQLIDALIEGLFGAQDKIIAMAPKIVMNLLEAIIKAAPRIALGAVQLIVQFISGITGSFGQILATGAKIIQQVKDGIHQKLEDAKNWGKDLIDNFLAGITAKWEALKQKISGIGNFIKGILGHSHPEFGPMADDYKWMPDMMALFTQGIEKNTDKLQKAAAKAFDLSDAVTMPEMSYTSPVSAKASYTTQRVKTDSDAKFDEIMGILQQYLPQLANMKMVMDTGTLVGELTPGIDAELGMRQRYAMRGATV